MFNADRFSRILLVLIALLLTANLLKMFKSPGIANAQGAPYRLKRVETFSDGTFQQTYGQLVGFSCWGSGPTTACYAVWK
jgi:hypothetical protein